MTIYTYIYVALNVLGLGALIGAGKMNVSTIISTLLIIPLIGRVLGWW